MQTSEPASAHTDFSQYSHQQLQSMLDAGDPQSATDAATAWGDAGRFLHDQASALEQSLSGFTQQWSGGAADQYQRMMTDLAGGLRTVAQNALTMRDLSAEAAESLSQAKAAMPAPVGVPSVSPEAMAMASSPLSVQPGMTAAQVTALQQQQSSAVAAVRAQQQAQSQSDAAHARAVQVMTTLAGDYSTEQDSIPATPDAAAAPAVAGGEAVDGPAAMGAMTAPTDGSAFAMGMTGTAVPGAASGRLIDTTGAITSASATPASALVGKPLFGDMFVAGLAAASAAAAGRFGAIVPRLPSFLGRGATKKPAKSTPSAASDAAAAAAAARAGRLALGAGGGGTGGGIGAGSIGGAGIGGIGVGSGGAAPSSYPGLISGSAGSITPSGASFAAGAAAAGGTGSAGTSGMMPAMPYGAGMAGAGMDAGGRRTPSWLVETEDVWGEKSAVAPSIVGEEPGW